MLISACCFSERRDLSYEGHEAILTRSLGIGRHIFHFARNLLLFMYSVYFNELYMFLESLFTRTFYTLCSRLFFTEQ